MKKNIFKVSLKFGLILGIYDLLTELIKSYTYNPVNLSGESLLVTGILSWTYWLLLVIFLFIAHYEFNKKNDNYISFKDAILIGLYVLLISYIIPTIYSLIDFLISNGKTQIFRGENFGIKTILLTSLILLSIKIVLLFIIITIESNWKIYKKAGKKGWASIVPIYNVIVLLEIVKKPHWWIIMFIIPFVNIIFAIRIINLLAKRFEKDEDFTIGLIFLPFIFYPILGLSKLEYNDNEEEE